MSMRTALAGLLITAAPIAAFAANFTSPEDAIRSLEAAYIAKDLEAAVAAKDFNAEAMFMLQSINPDFAEDPELLTKTAGVLELSFKREMKEHGFPDFAGLECSLSEAEEVSAHLVKITERCVSPGGSTSVEDVHVFEGAQGWHVVVLPE
jgi:hypothetical protein